LLMAETSDSQPTAPGIMPRRRHPCGRPLGQPTTRRGRKQRAQERARETVADVKGVALAQPHRKGQEEWGRSTAVGRLILDGKVKPLDGQPTSVAIDAAHRYLKAYQGYLWAIDRARPWAGTTPASTRMHVATYVPEEGELVEPAPVRRSFSSDADVIEESERKLAAYSEVQRAIRSFVPNKKDAERIEKALHLAILDEPGEDWIAPFWIMYSLPQGLKGLVDFYGIGE
jgi:hypothetical protein